VIYFALRLYQTVQRRVEERLISQKRRGGSGSELIYRYLSGENEKYHKHLSE
jgi:hypothetical protein